MSEEIKMQLDRIIGVLNAVYCYESESQLKEIEEKIINIITNSQQKVEQLEERCEYLERSNNRREDEITELRDENVDLVSKNKQLENIRKEAIKYVTKKWYSKNTEDINKMVSFGNWEIDLLNILNKGGDKE